MMKIALLNPDKAQKQSSCLFNSNIHIQIQKEKKVVNQPKSFANV
jgi:hypothetical protein